MNQAEPPKKKRVRRPWHQIFGEMLELVLQPVGITVFLELEVLSASPKMDVLILRNNLPGWTEEQRECLPDGIRDTSAGHIVIEFKYTESFNEAAVGQTYSYDLYYKAKTRLDEKDVKTFLVCSKTPQVHSLKAFGFQSVKPGVFTSTYKLVQHITLISLNDLTDQPHNATFKAFASRSEEKKKAFASLIGRISGLTGPLVWFTRSLYRMFLVKGAPMITEFSKEELLEMGKVFGPSILAEATIDERLEGLEPDEVLSRYSSDEVLRRYSSDEVLRRYSSAERLEGIEADEVLRRYSPDEVLRRYSSAERLEGIEVDEILSKFSHAEIQAFLNRNQDD